MLFSGNKLEEVRAGVFNNLELSVLDLSKNFITIIESAAFNNMPNLLHINLADNRIQTWNKNWFENTPLLSRISMQNNSIEDLPNEAFGNLKGVKMFGKLDLTVNLVFSYNKIKEIQPRAFDNLIRIRNLWLDHNQLEEFDASLLDNVKIDDLRIDHNNIKCLNGDLSKVFKAKSTHIDSNPLECKCLESIKSYVKNNTVEVDFFFADMDCTAQRIRKKIDAVEKRLKEISGMNNEGETESTSNADKSSNNNKPIK